LLVKFAKQHPTDNTKLNRGLINKAVDTGKAQCGAIQIENFISFLFLSCLF